MRFHAFPWHPCQLSVGCGFRSLHSPPAFPLDQVFTGVQASTKMILGNRKGFLYERFSDGKRQ